MYFIYIYIYIILIILLEAVPNQNSEIIDGENNCDDDHDDDDIDPSGTYLIYILQPNK